MHTLSISRLQGCFHRYFKFRRSRAMVRETYWLWTVPIQRHLQSLTSDTKTLATQIWFQLTIGTTRPPRRWTAGRKDEVRPWRPGYDKTQLEMGTLTNKNMVQCVKTPFLLPMYIFYFLQVSE